MYVSTAAIVACMIAAANSRRRQEEEEEKKKRAIKEGEVQVLLLNQNGEAMEIASNEKVLMIKVIEKDHYGNWFARLDGNSIDVEGRSFDECFQKIMDKFNPKGVQIVPFSVNRDCVDGYFVIIKVVNEEMIKKRRTIKRDGR